MDDNLTFVIHLLLKSIYYRTFPGKIKKNRRFSYLLFKIHQSD